MSEKNMSRKRNDDDDNADDDNDKGIGPIQYKI